MDTVAFAASWMHSKRHQDFHAVGGRLSDHGLDHRFSDFPAVSMRPPLFLTKFGRPVR